MNGDEFFERYEAGLRDVNLTGAILTDTFFGEPCFRRVNLTGVDS